MTSRIRCVGCGAESFLGEDTAVFCVTCAKKLRDEIERLERQVNLQKAWTRSFYNAKQKAEAELEKLREQTSA